MHEEVVWFDKGWYWPAAHVSHGTLWPVSSWYCPDEHASHESLLVSSWYLPAGQLLHTDELVCAAPAAEYLPIPQLVHTEGLVCATAAPAAEYWPGPQEAVQLACPAASLNWPAGQSAQSWKQIHGYPFKPHELPLLEFQ